MPPLIIVAFGSEINGLTATIQNIISYISLVGAGISIATIQSLYGPIKSNNIEEIRKKLKATENMFNKYGYVFLFFVFITAFIYPLIIKNSTVEYTTSVILMLIMSIKGCSEFFIVGKYRVLLYADRKIYVSSIIQSISLAISLIVAIILLKLKCNIILVQSAISAVYVSRALIITLYIRKKYPQYINLKNINPDNSAIKNRKYALIHQISGLCVTSCQTIILSIMVNLEAASIYAVYNIVFSGIKSICSNLNSSITPFLGHTYTDNNLTKTNRQFKIVEVIFSKLILFVFICTGVLVIPFISLYTINADINYTNTTLAILFLTLGVFDLYRLPANAMINVAGHFKETQQRAIIEATISVIGGILFTYILGIYGVLIGTICAIGWRSIDIILYTNKFILKNSSKETILRLIRIIIISIISLFIFINLKIEIHNWNEWLLLCGFIIFLALIISIIDIFIFDYKYIKFLKSKL